VCCVHVVSMWCVVPSAKLYSTRFVTVCTVCPGSVPVLAQSLLLGLGAACHVGSAGVNTRHLAC
jgi:hypothetical protein